MRPLVLPATAAILLSSSTTVPRSWPLYACDGGPPPTQKRSAARPSLPSPPEPLNAADDPIYKEELWLQSEMVRYGDGALGAGIGHCASYRPFTLAGNHSRAVLILSTGAHEESVLSFANRIAVSCECVAFVPLLRGGCERWSHERLAHEAWAAVSYLNGACGAESLAILGIGAAAQQSTALLATGALGAHAAIALCPTGDPVDAHRAARELPVPLLAVCAGGAAGRAQAAALSAGLALNSQLGSDFYVADFGENTADFVLDPRDEADAGAAERVLALVQSWVDQCCPERLLRQSRGG